MSQSSAVPRPTNPMLMYARLGAQIRLSELDAERKAINRMFPGLHWQKTQGVKSAQGALPRPRGRTFTDAQRKAISDRMKRTWAERLRKTSAT